MVEEDPPAAAWLAEALETGNPLAPLPPGMAPATIEAGEAIAAAVVDRLGLPVCGARVAPGPGGTLLAGPLVETRLLRDGATLALAALRHARATPALLLVLAAPLVPGEDTPPAIAALHPAIDIAAWRFRDPPGDPALGAADLGGHGLVVAGHCRAGPPPATLTASLLPEGRRAPRRPGIALALETAALSARRLGGLPAGAALLLAGLGPDAAVPEPGARLVARFGPRIGRAVAGFA